MFHNSAWDFGLWKINVHLHFIHTFQGGGHFISWSLHFLFSNYSKQPGHKRGNLSTLSLQLTIMLAKPRWYLWYYKYRLSQKAWSLHTNINSWSSEAGGEDSWSSKWNCKQYDKCDPAENNQVFGISNTQYMYIDRWGSSMVLVFWFLRCIASSLMIQNMTINLVKFNSCNCLYPWAYTIMKYILFYHVLNTCIVTCTNKQLP